MGTRVQAYDVHARSKGGTIHFQVLVSLDKEFDDAKKFAEAYLKSFTKSGKIESISKTGSNQGATPEQEDDVVKKGHFIYKVHGCPAEKPTTPPSEEN